MKEIDEFFPYVIGAFEIGEVTAVWNHDQAGTRYGFGDVGGTGRRHEIILAMKGMTEKKVGRETIIDPQKKLVDLSRGKGAPQLYMPVPWRIYWFRLEHLDDQIATECVYRDREYQGGYREYRAEARYRAASGDQAIGTGFGACSLQQFNKGPNEKAETKAIGRALAALGYGTQYATEFEDGEGFDLSDSPVSHAERSSTAVAPRSSPPVPNAETPVVATASSMVERDKARDDMFALLPPVGRARADQPGREGVQRRGYGAARHELGGQLGDGISGRKSGGRY